MTRRDKAAEKQTGVEKFVSDTILRNVRVLAIDQTIDDKGGVKTVLGKTATLEITEPQAEMLTLSRQLGTVSLTLRSIRDTQTSRRASATPARTIAATSIRCVSASARWEPAIEPAEDFDDDEKDSGRATSPRTTGLRILACAALACAPWACALRALRSSPRRVVAPRALAGNVGYGGPPPQMVHVTSSDVNSQPIALGVSKSVVIDLPRDIKDVLVADPKIANAVVRSARRAYIIGSTAGQTNVYFFDAQGQQIAGFDIAVTRDLNGMREAIHQVLPDSDITVEGIGDGVVLAGTASSQAEAQQAYDIAARLLGVGSADTVGQGSKVVNAIVVRGGDQVMIKVTVAEVERDLVKQLGINLSGSLGYGTAVLNFNNTNPFSASGQPLSTSAITGGFKNVSATLAGHGAGRRHSYARRAEPDRDLRRDRDFRRRRRISGPQRL